MLFTRDRTTSQDRASSGGSWGSSTWGRPRAHNSSSATDQDPTRPANDAADRPVGQDGPASDADQVVEVYENERWSRKRSGWVSPRPSRCAQWTTRSGMPAQAPDETPPPQDFTWVSNWRIDTGQRKDKMGWEYATAAEKLGPDRVPRAKEKWNDRARRRRWVRIARQKVLTGDRSAAEELGKRAQEGLKGMVRGRRMVAELLDLIGTRSDSGELRTRLRQLVSLVRQHAREVDHILASIDRELVPAVKKLSNDFAREQKQLGDLARECERKLKELPLRDSLTVSSKCPMPRTTGPADSTVRLKEGGAAEDPKSIGLEGELYDGPAVTAGRAAFRPAVYGGGAGAAQEGAYLSKSSQEELILSQMTFEDEDAVMDCIVRERAEVIEQITRNIVELRDIFKDFSQLVHEQQESMDEIESHVRSANNRAAEGLDSIMRAAAIQRDSTCSVS